MIIKLKSTSSKPSFSLYQRYLHIKIRKPYLIWKLFIWPEKIKTGRHTLFISIVSFVVLIKFSAKKKKFEDACVLILRSRCCSGWGEGYSIVWKMSLIQKNPSLMGKSTVDQEVECPEKSPFNDPVQSALIVSARARASIDHRVNHNVDKVEPSWRWHLLGVLCVFWTAIGCSYLHDEWQFCPLSVQSCT